MHGPTCTGRLGQRDASVKPDVNDLCVPFNSGPAASGTPPPPPATSDASETFATTPNTPVNGNLLSNANLPAGSSARVVGFTIQGDSTVYTPGATPVQAEDPITGQVVGSFEVRPDGVFTFTPAPGYIGPVPSLSYTVAGSDGRTDASTLSIDVVNSEFACWVSLS